MRIAIVNQHPRDVTGGSELQCDLIARGLVGRGHAVRYVAASPDGTAASLDQLEGMPYGTVRVTRNTAGIVAACLGHAADVVYWRMNRPGLAGVAQGLAVHGVPVVLATAHADDVSPWPIWDVPYRSGVRGVLAGARRAVTHRATWPALRHVAGIAAQRQDFLGRAPVRSQRLVRNVFAASLLDDGVVGQRWEWPRPYVVWVGNVKSRKRPEELLPLAVPLAQIGVDLIVIGAITDARYAAMFAAGATGSNVHPIGERPLSEVLMVVAGARALVVTAREEGFSNVLVQAWWEGTPVISLGYDPDGLIARHGLGVVCGERRAEFCGAVAASARSDDDSGRARIADFARSTFALDKNLEALEALFRDVIARGPAGRGTAS